MKKAVQIRRGRPALDVIEEAVRLLRRAPINAFIAYYAGSIPCILGLIYFLADMSKGAFARSYLTEAALGAAALYLWMKCWQTVFASILRATLALQPPPRWTAGRIAKLVLAQVTLQPIGLFTRFFAAQIVLPYVWVYGFFQAVTVLGDGDSDALREVIRNSMAQTRLWLRQAHYGILFLSVFGLFVWLNVTVFCGLAPQILKTFFGIETVFSLNPLGMINSTIIATTFGMTYLCFDPLRKAFFVVRCFYGSALVSGDDLLVELKSIRAKPTLATAAAILFLFTVPIQSTSAKPTKPAAAMHVESQDLDQSIDRVLQRREYAWRMPREKVPESSKGWLTVMMEDIFKAIGRLIEKAVDAIGKFFDWFKKLFSRKESAGSETPASTFDLAGSAKWILYGLIAILIAGIAILIIRMKRLSRLTPIALEPIAPVPDLTSENIVADQLPEDGWLKLARELVQRGELRLALRASYLAGLAHLGHRELISIARHKSNMDYERELRRRARSQDALVGAFDANISAFERAWYGLHEVNQETLDGFNQNLEKIRTC